MIQPKRREQRGARAAKRLKTPQLVNGRGTTGLPASAWQHILSYLGAIVIGEVRGVSAIVRDLGAVATTCTDARAAVQQEWQRLGTAICDLRYIELTSTVWEQKLNQLRHEPTQLKLEQLKEFARMLNVRPLSGRKSEVAERLVRNLQQHNVTGVPAVVRLAAFFERNGPHYRNDKGEVYDTVQTLSERGDDVARVAYRMRLDGSTLAKYQQALLHGGYGSLYDLQQRLKQLPLCVGTGGSRPCRHLSSVACSRQMCVDCCSRSSLAEGSPECCLDSHRTAATQRAVALTEKQRRASITRSWQCKADGCRNTHAARCEQQLCRPCCSKVELCCPYHGKPWPEQQIGEVQVQSA